MVLILIMYQLKPENEKVDNFCFVQGFNPNTGLWNIDRREGIYWIHVYISSTNQSETVNMII